ncbi:MAG: hypothetical protein ACE3JQ_08055 [Paenisporosarcina sp.]
MNPSNIRGLGIGLFVAGLFLTLSTSSSSQSTSERVPKGYELIESSKLTKLKEELSTSKEQLARIQLDLKAISKDNVTKKDAVNEQSPDISKTILTISQGMNSIDVSLTLEQMGIIKNQKDLYDYLINNNLSERIQIGTYEINSSMTIEDLADLLTK